MSLSAIRVLDFSRLLPGAVATQILADMGAQVIKVEDTGRGDYLRTLSVNGAQTRLFFNLVNRNKRSIALNIKAFKKSPLVNRAISQLIRTHDVLVEGFRPGVMASFGLGYDDVKRLNPKIIYCAITGFGQNGVYASRPGHDLNYMGLSGMLNVGRQPTLSLLPFQAADQFGGGLAAVIHILGALLDEERGGYIDVSMTHHMASFGYLLNAMALDLANQDAYKLLLGHYPCYHLYETKDHRYISVAAVEPKFWEVLCEVLEAPSLLGAQFDPRAIARIAKIVRRKPLDEWAKILLENECSTEPVLDYLEPHPALEFNPFFDSNLSTPFNKGVVPIDNGSGPEHGAHTSEILTACGFSDSEIADGLQHGLLKRAM